MRQDIYNHIREALEGLGEIRHIDLWNRNAESIDEEAPWERPAVFVEFRPVRWREIESRVEYRCTPQVALHIVTEWVPAWGGAPGAEMMFDLPRLIHERLAGLCGERFYGLELVESHTNHDHEEILDMVEVYECEASRIF